MNLKISQQNLPNSPGVYLFRDSNQKVLYVGKAKNLKKRVASYFANPQNLPPDKKLMVRKANHLESIIVDNETEALLLEDNLIKKHRPPYNIVFKDDKSYVYIQITRETFPRIFLNRKTPKKQNLLFGPYTSSENARATLRVLRKIFPYRTCRKMSHHTCLYHHLKLCPGPCENKISAEEYQSQIKEISSFLQGREQFIIQNLKKEIKEKSSRQEFEQAAILRDRLFGLQKIQEQQKVISHSPDNLDVLNLAIIKNEAAVNLFFVRQGKLIGKENFILSHLKNKTEKQILQSFIKSYYLGRLNLPPLIVLHQKIKHPFSFSLLVPQKGNQKKLLALSRDNALQFLKQKKAIGKELKLKNLAALSELASYLKLAKIPKRIEAYDISNIQGLDATGSMIVFQNGQADKKSYRRFKIKTIHSPNDVAMIQEILTRRLQRLNEKGAWPNPDLILVDGGKPQLNAALAILKKTKNKISLCALAKKLEQVYLPNQKDPIAISQSSPSLMLLKRIRDEAHRFAISYHHKLREKKMFQ